MKSGMRDCLPAVLFRNITSVMDDLKATDGSADYLGEKLCLKKKFCRDCQCWENRSESNIPLPVGPVCVRRLTQPFTFSFFPLLPHKGLSNGGIHLLGAVVFSCQRTKQISRGNLTCDCQPRRWYVSRVQWFQMSCSLARQGSMPIPYKPRTCFPVEAATSTADFQIIDSPLWLKAKWNTQILLPETHLWLEDLASSSLVMFHTSWCMKTSEGGDRG